MAKRQKPFTVFTHQEGFEFLSNMRQYPIQYEGEIFRASENVYQFSKLPDELKNSYKKRFAKMHPFVARKMTRKLPVRDDWEDVKLQVMLQVLILKFSQHPDLKEKLLEIEGPIVEYNYWKDTFWGYDVNLKKGSNYLGKLLMLIRDAWKFGKKPSLKNLPNYEIYTPEHPEFKKFLE